MKQLRDRVAVVTGAASGIGRATSLALARRGCHVALVDLDAAALGPVADEVKALGRSASVHAADVADRARMEALPDDVVREHGGVHVVVNNAGVSCSGTLAEVSIDDFEWVLGINLRGVVYGSKLFLPYLLAQDEGHIVNVSSMFGFIGFPGQAAYCTSKFAVRGFSEALYAELSGTGVGVTSVHPGAIRTPIVRATRGIGKEELDRTLELFERWGTDPERVAERILHGIERRRLRVVVTPEAHVTDWIKRLFPVLTHRILARQYRRGGSRGGTVAGPRSDDAG